MTFVTKNSIERKLKSNYKTGNLLGTNSHLACYHNKLVTGYQKPVHLSANKQIEESCGMKYVKNSTYTSCVLIIEERSIKLPVECQQSVMPRGLWHYVVCGQLI